jgi:hypothetical protein
MLTHLSRCCQLTSPDARLVHWPDLGPSPAEDGVPAFDETYEFVCESPGRKPLNVRAGVVHVRDRRRAEVLMCRQGGGHIRASRLGPPVPQ